jgi:dihydrodipicolinate synthase/N-acetylneuraminate lyase
MLRALQAGDLANAETIRAKFNVLEALRNAHGPIPVLHHAVELAGIAATGPALPLMRNVETLLQTEIKQAADALRTWDAG